MVTARTRAARPKPCNGSTNPGALVCLVNAPVSAGELAPPSLRAVRSNIVASPSAVEFILYMRIDYGRKIGVGAKSEAFCPRRIEIARPAGDDSGDGLVRLAADKGDGLVACNRAQSLDLLADGDAPAGQIERAAGPEERGGEFGRAREELNCGAGRGVPMTDIFADRQNRLLTGQRLADD